LAEGDETGLRHVSATRAVSRIELANYLLDSFGENPNYQRESRHERSAPHLGRVELASIYRGTLYEPLTSVIDGPITLGGCAI
jgi:dTDP-4-dehydrorhamnose reductase